MSREQKLSHLSVEEYLKFEAKANFRHEYLNGQIFAMTGGTVAHNRLSLNIFSKLNPQIAGSICEVFVADIKVNAKAANAFYYPDVLVNCTPQKNKDVVADLPAVIFEVSSPSTAATDQREKLVAYQQIPSLKAYVIARQSRKHISVYRRIDEKSWTLQELTSGDEFTVEVCSGKTICLEVDDIYENTDITENMTVKEDEELYIW